MPGDTVRINGNLYSWGSVSAKFGGVLYTGITSIKYSDSRERAAGYGMGLHQAPIAKTRGKYAVEPVVVKFYPHAAEALRAQIAQLSPSGTDYGTPEIPIVLQLFEPGRDPETVELLRCTWSKSTSDNEEGPDALTEEVEFHCLKIIRNGRTLFDSSQGAP